MSLFILAVTPILFLVFLALTPPVNPTFDDAKYIGVGRNFLDGNGPTTVFGVVFLKHSPLWPMIIVIPEKLFGIHPVATGHVINAVSGALTIVLVGFLGWRVRPAIGAVAAVLFAAPAVRLRHRPDRRHRPALDRADPALHHRRLQRRPDRIDLAGDRPRGDLRGRVPDQGDDPAVRGRPVHPRR